MNNKALKEKEKYILIGIPIIYLSTWILMYILPRKVFHVPSSAGVEGWLVFFLIFFILPLLLFIFLITMGVSSENSKGFAYGSVFLAIPFMLLIKYEDDIEMEKYKLETTGVVSRAWIRKQKNRSRIWNVQATYQVSNRSYTTSSKNDEHMILSVGDTVTILYSSKTPEMSQIKELVDYYDR